jgi:hypothetical protein
MVAYLGKQCVNATENVTPTHGTVLKLIQKADGIGHKLLVDNYFSLFQLFSDLYSRKIHSCITVRQDRKGRLANSGPKMLKLKKGDLLCQVLFVGKINEKLSTHQYTPAPSTGH